MTRSKGGALATLLLLLPPLALYVGVYLLPMLAIGSASVDNGVLGQRFPRLAAWAASAAPVDDAAAAALLADLGALRPEERAEAARMLNQDQPGFRSLIMTTGNAGDTIGSGLAALRSFDARWAEDRFWFSLRQNLEPVTWRHFRKALGLGLTPEGDIVRVEGGDIYLRIMLRTLVIGFEVAALTVLIGYPLAYAVVNGGRRLRSLVLGAVLLGFWTSILVRTTAWVVLLQTNGLINGLLLRLGIVEAPLPLIFNRFGTVVAITHVLLPFAILPIVNVMRQIPAAQRDASRSLGAGPIETFLRVYLPQTLRGVVVGGGTVFILALGFYVTPALVGGPGDQMLAYYIADFMQKQLNWGMASALGIMLLAAVAAVLALWFVPRLFASPSARRP